MCDRHTDVEKIFDLCCKIITRYDFHDHFSGVFTAPQSGVYQVSVYGTPGDNNVGNSGQVFIKKNDEVLCTMRITGGNSGTDNLGADTNGCTAIAELTPEDSVRVTGSSDDSAFILSLHGAGFVGHMIQPYC